MAGPFTSTPVKLVRELTEYSTSHRVNWPNKTLNCKRYTALQLQLTGTSGATHINWWKQSMITNDGWSRNDRCRFFWIHTHESDAGVAQYLKGSALRHPRKQPRQQAHVCTQGLLSDNKELLHTLVCRGINNIVLSHLLPHSNALCHRGTNEYASPLGHIPLGLHSTTSKHRETERAHISSKEIYPLRNKKKSTLPFVFC